MANIAAPAIPVDDTQVIKWESARCEICKRTATHKALRRWHDGAVDKDVTLCKKHTANDPDGMWTMENVRNING